ncbi:uncharacterized protein LOC130988041 [Salvia miltiorrhiza]|uniref:uncharacterized protein LOC130988041 n=1 Tax=Salvia miltiorrhiza TaxID=226208 RepID=UPI0025AD4337|nr:uncharacterized protein LOC130988041 [Salvia miltiorrhiza]
MLSVLRVIAVVTIFVTIAGAHARYIPDYADDGLTSNEKTSFQDSQILGFFAIMRKCFSKGLDRDGSIKSGGADNVFRPALPPPPPPKSPPGPHASISPDEIEMPSFKKLPQMFE